MRMLNLNKLPHALLCIFLSIAFFAGCQNKSADVDLQQYTGKDPVLGVLKFLKVDYSESLDRAPHFPNPEEFMDGQDNTGYTQAFKSWTENHFDEFQAFANHDDIKSKGFAWESLGMKNPYIIKKYYSPFSQAAAGLDKARLKEIAPHFPSEDLAKSQEEYETLIKQWQDEHMQEYEDFLNAPEIMAMKPSDSRALVDLGIQPELPEFMSYPDFGEDYPAKGENEPDDVYALKLQHWHFVYHPEEYEEKYGQFPTLPEGFDLDAYIKQYTEGTPYEYEAK